jgi:cytochrome b
MSSSIIWDKFVRLFHWSTASLFLLNYFVLEAGEDLHEWAGYVIAGLVVLRIIWGFIGSPRARFSDFFPTPTRLKGYVKTGLRAHSPEQGHNPLGGAMILFMLLLLLSTATSGWMMGLDQFWGEDWVETLHSYAANAMFGAVVIHVAAVVVMQKLTGIKLIKAMVRGRRL